MKLNMLVGVISACTCLVAAAGDRRNLVENGNFEKGTPGSPAFWYQDSWGNNNALFEYPVKGWSGSKAARITVDNYYDGAVKWQHNDVPVQGGKWYIYRVRYQANAPCNLTVRFTYGDGSYSYHSLLRPPLTFKWKWLRVKFLVPEGAVSATSYVALNSNGSAVIDNVSIRKH